MLTVKEVAARLKVHVQTVYKWIYAGKLEVTRVNGILRITEEQYARFVGGGKE